MADEKAQPDDRKPEGGRPQERSRTGPSSARPRPTPIPTRPRASNKGDGAGCRDRTRDPLITNQVLYQLS